MKKVGVVSCYFKDNFGSLLQSYAIQKFLDNNKIPNETISIEKNIDFKNKKIKYYLSQITNFPFIKNKIGMVKFKIDTIINKELKKNILIRKQKFKKFREEFNLSEMCINYQELSELAKQKYDDIIVGSDQLWLPVNVVSDYYTLNWVPKGLNKISFSTSFGFSSIPKKYYPMYKKFLNKINFLSTREQTGLEIIKEITGKDAILACDPTMLLTREEWEKEFNQERILKEKYIFCYFMGKNKQHRIFAEELKKNTGYKIVSLNHMDEFVPYSDKFCDYSPYDVGPREWMNLIANAEIVLTDSFHGTIFSLLFNKVFFNFRRHDGKSKVSTNSRLDSILDVVGVSKERILTGYESPNDVLQYKINFENVNKEIKKFREQSQGWLLNSIKTKKKTHQHIEIDNEKLCCGCSSCKNVCPKNAILMKEDKKGFKYPVVDLKKCINCGLCIRSCPILNKKIEKKKIQKGYVVNNRNKLIRKESTSGGMFTAIAEYVISKKGKVYGVAFDERFNAIHKSIDSIDQLYFFRNSKYVQSDPLDTFKEVKNDLLNEKIVCYSGTPCQIEGLLSYLNKDYKNLILVDIVCRAVPSPKMLRKYLTYIKKEKLDGEDIEDVKFRDKSKYGYKYTQMKIMSKNHTYEEGIDTDPYLRAFFSGTSIRPSCASCKFKKRYRVSDFTIWDCFNIEEFEKRMDDNIGTTRVLIHSEKGNKIFEEIKKKLEFNEVDPDELTKNSKELIFSTKINKKNKEFLSSLDEKTMNELLKEYFPINFKTKLEKMGRTNLVNIRSYKKIKKVFKKILRR